MEAELAKTILFNIALFGYQLGITKPIILIWAVSLFIIVFFAFAIRIKRFRTIAELCIDFSESQFGSIFPHYTKFWMIFFLTLFVFIVLNNLVGAIPTLESPSGNINFTASLALGVFFFSMLISIKLRGWGYLRQFFPSDVPKILWPMVGPIEILTYMARPLSLALRLFANMFAGHMIQAVFILLIGMIPSYLLLLKFLPFAVVVLVKLFDLFIAFIQAFIFTFLSASYISDALKDDHH